MSDHAMTMRRSRVLERMRADQVALSVKINLADPRSVEIAGLAGFDCVWLDLEHVPNTLHDVENQIRAAKAYDMDTLVRVRRGGYSELVVPLEMDAAGIMVPHVMSLADAQQVAWYTRFHPVGRRPIDGGNADGAFCMIPWDAYMKDANTERFVTVQIEDPEPLDDLEAIAAVDGIDVLFFGPGDFTQGIGKPGQFDDPAVIDARRRMAEAARAHGKFAATAGGVDSVPALVEMGYRFISVGADVVALGNAFREIVKAVKGG